MKHLYPIVLVAFLSFACGGSGKKPVTSLDGSLPDGETVSGETLPQPDATVPDASDTTSGELVGDAVPLPELAAETAAETTAEVIEEVAPEVTPEVVPEVTPEIEEDVPTPPDGGCIDIWNCGLELGCPQLGKACWEVCMEGTTDFAKAEFMAFSDCVDSKCGDVPEDQQGDCMWKECFGELTTCLGGTGTADCSETFECMTTCPKDDGMCVFGCLQNASQEAVEIALKMDGGEDQMQFYWLIECMGGKGEAGCGDTVTCLNGCNKEAGDPTCTFACIKESSEAAKLQLQDMFGCGQGGVCMDKMIACVGGGGDQTCGGVFQCVFDCQKDNPPPEPGQQGADCMTPCIALSSPQGAEELTAMFTCLNEKCPNTGQDQEPCPEAMVCFALCPDFPAPM